MTQDNAEAKRAMDRPQRPLGSYQPTHITALSREMHRSVEPRSVRNFSPDQVTDIPRAPEANHLDPTDWEGARTLAYRIIDDTIARLSSAGEQPAWQTMPARAKASLDGPAPLEPTPLASVYDEFRDVIQPYTADATHPRFWGWYIGGGTFTGALADFLAATMNCCAIGGDNAPTYVETQVLQWLKTLFGFPDAASGLLTSGASVANLIGLTVARDSVGHLPSDADSRSPRPVFYTTSQSHSCNARALKVLGFQSDALRAVPVNDDFSINCTALERAIVEDLACGLRPVGIIATAGTTNTGAVDDLRRLGQIARHHELWLHVDAAIGGAALLATDLKDKLAGIEQADSVGFDLHKWMQLPIEVGCALVRNADAHLDSFRVDPDYLKDNSRGVAAKGTWFHQYGLQTSRQFRALKVWMTLKEQGSRRLGAMVSRTAAIARHFGRLIEVEPALELMAPISLNIVCFRYTSKGLTDLQLDQLNNEIMLRLQDSGLAVLSDTRLHGRRALRAAIANHRSQYADCELVVAEVLRLGGMLQRDAGADVTSLIP
ncbi:MAG: amino acid decarboxylase [Gammaproteobacteria bacterium]|nr:amino acid decarboxylase [Gammaproteobacteria bacterium]